MFSDAISSISWRCRPSSPRIAAAISGSASVRGAGKNESGAEPGLALALGDERLTGGLSPPPPAVWGVAYGPVLGTKAAVAGFPIGRGRPSTWGKGPIFMQSMGG